MTTPLIQARPLDALRVSSEVFIQTAKDVLKKANAGELGEVPLLFGSSSETMRPAGTVYVVPQSKRRAAFPLLWDTERFQYQYPQLFQALKGPEWPVAFDVTSDPNGTLHLSDDLLSDEGGDIKDLPEYIDAYISERLPDKGLLLLYRPMFSSVDRVRAVVIPPKDNTDEEVTTFLRELYGFHPSTNIVPSGLAIKGTAGVPEGYGVPEIKTAAASSWRYVSAPSLKEAKKKTRFYTSYSLAKDHGDKDTPVFRFKVEDGTPDWKSAKEMHSEAEDTITSKVASDKWLKGLEKLEYRKMSSRFKKALGSTEGPETFIEGTHTPGEPCVYCTDPAEGVIESPNPEGTLMEPACKSCWSAKSAPVSEDEYSEWMRSGLSGSMDPDLSAGIHSDPTV